MEDTPAQGAFWRAPVEDGEETMGAEGVAAWWGDGLIEQSHAHRALEHLVQVRGIHGGHVVHDFVKHNGLVVRDTSYGTRAFTRHYCV